MSRPVVLAAMLAMVWSSAGVAQNARTFTVNPVMAKGAADAPVTIWEFSDYQ